MGESKESSTFDLINEQMITLIERFILRPAHFSSRSMWLVLIS